MKAVLKPILAKNESKKVSKDEFMKYIKTLQKSAEISTLTTNVYSFEWHEINVDKNKFLKKLKDMKFKKAYVSIFYPDTKLTDYSSFIIV